MAFASAATALAWFATARVFRYCSIFHSSSLPFILETVAPHGACRQGLKWGVAAVKERVDAITAFLFSRIPTSSVVGNTEHWQAAFDALLALQERVVTANAPPPRQRDAPPADPHEVAAKWQGDGERIQYWLSTTHTVTCQRGQKIEDESVRTLVDTRAHTCRRRRVRVGREGDGGGGRG